MAQIRTKNELSAAPNLRSRIVGAIKWWGEHQAWPATDEIRVHWRCSAGRR
jgi:hypothetical protein